MKQGDKPWLVTIVYPGKLNEIASDKWWHSTYVMKTLYFMQRDLSDSPPPRGRTGNGIQKGNENLGKISQGRKECENRI